MMGPAIRAFHVLINLCFLLYIPVAVSEALPEFRVKAAFVYNFIAFTEWPDTVGTTLSLCMYGQSPLNEEIDLLQGRRVKERQIITRKEVGIEDLKNCQIVFIPNAAINNLPDILNTLSNEPILTIADIKDASSQGIAISMSAVKNKIRFEANLKAAQLAGLDISSKLLRLATKVYQ